MAIAFNVLDVGAEETTTDNVMTSASISPTLNAVLYIAVVGTNSSGMGTHNVTAPSGLSGTFNALTPTDGQIYGSRRILHVYRGTKATAWGTGTLTINTNGANVTQDMAYSIIEATGVDTADPDDAPVSGAVTSGTLTLGDVGTVDAGDAVLVVGAHENAGESFACTGYTEIGTGLDNLTNVRQIKFWSDDSSPDETPELTQSGSTATGAIAFVVNVGEAAGTSIPKGPFGHPLHGPLKGPVV